MAINYRVTIPLIEIAYLNIFTLHDCGRWLTPYGSYNSFDLEFPRHFNVSFQSLHVDSMRNEWFIVSWTQILKYYQNNHFMVVFVLQFRKNLFKNASESMTRPTDCRGHKGPARPIGVLHVEIFLAAFIYNTLLPSSV